MGTATRTRLPVLAASLFLLSTLMITRTPVPAYAWVGLEYLGPYPLQPKPVDGQPQTLADSGTIGNTGTDQAVYTLSLVADLDFQKYFTVTFSDNNFTINPGDRKEFIVTFKFDPSTPTHDWSARISIIARAVQGGGGGTGVASFNLPVKNSWTAVPEFPNGIGIMVLAAMLGVAIFLIRKNPSITSPFFYLRTSKAVRSL